MNDISNAVDQQNNLSYCTSDIGSIEVMHVDSDCGDLIDSVRFCLAKSCDLDEYVQLMEDLKNVLKEEEDCEYKFLPYVAEFNGVSPWGVYWSLAIAIIGFTIGIGM
jgi:hypothetical protein